MELNSNCYKTWIKWDVLNLWIIKYKYNYLTPLYLSTIFLPMIISDNFLVVLLRNGQWLPENISIFPLNKLSEEYVSYWEYVAAPVRLSSSLRSSGNSHCWSHFGMHPRRNKYNCFFTSPPPSNCYCFIMMSQV